MGGAWLGWLSDSSFPPIAPPPCTLPVRCGCRKLLGEAGGPLFFRLFYVFGPLESEQGDAVDRIMPLPKDIHALIPWTCDYVTLRGNRDFAAMVKLRALRWGDSPALLSRWPQPQHVSPSKGKRRPMSGSERCTEQGSTGRGWL